MIARTREEQAIRTSYFSIFSNASLALIKLLAGILGQSYALIADGIESLTDVGSSILVLLGLKYAQRPADENHPYGHGKIEPLTTFVVVAFLVTSATLIASESIHHIQSPQTMPHPWTLLVLGGIIIWKELSYRWVIQKSKATNSAVLRADAWHHRSDAITSVMAFLGISIALLLGEGYEAADDWAALFAAGFILYNSYLIFRPALGEIMDEHLHDTLILEIRKKSMEVPDVLDTEKCFVRKSGMQYHVDLHIVVDAHISVKAGHQIAHNLKDHLMTELPDLAQVLIHVEPDQY